MTGGSCTIRHRWSTSRQANQPAASIITAVLLFSPNSFSTSSSLSSQFRLPTVLHTCTLLSAITAPALFHGIRLRFALHINSRHPHDAARHRRCNLVRDAAANDMGNYYHEDASLSSVISSPQAYIGTPPFVVFCVDSEASLNLVWLH